MQEDKKEVKVHRREFVGVVVSDKMDKTIVVEVKYVSTSKKYKAHDGENTANVGDTVRIIEGRPISKEKKWRLVDVVERVK